MSRLSEHARLRCHWQSHHYIYPSTGNINTLTEIERGGYRERFFVLEQGQEPDPIFGPHDEAADYKRELEKDSRWVKTGLAYVEVLELQRFAEYQVGLWLDTTGEQCLKTIRQSMVWNVEEKRPDIEATLEHWEPELGHTIVSDDTFKGIGRLPNRPEFKSLIGRFVFRKMQSQQMRDREDLWEKVI